ncbi:MAG: hypothetical protein ACRDGN_01865 [bacterium]
MFNWAVDFQKIALLNRRVLYTVHLALLLLFFMVGALSLIYAVELGTSTGLAFGFNLLYSLFWIWRLAWQLYYFKGRVPLVRVLMVVWFALLASAYLLPVLYRLSADCPPW